MSWLSTLFNGNATVNNAGNSLIQSGNAATTTGLADTSAASGFWNSILSGNAQKQGQVLAPEISGIQGQAQQQRQTTSQFGNRSGGNNASMQMSSDSASASINDMIAKLLGSSASGLASLGSSLFGQGSSNVANGASTLLSNKSEFDSLLNSAATGASSALTKFAMK